MTQWQPVQASLGAGRMRMPLVATVSRAALVLVAFVAAVAAAAQPSLLKWHAGTSYRYQVDSLWWSGRAGSQDVLHTAWDPPVAPENHGMRCNIAVVPVRREAWPPTDPSQPPNSWLMRVSVLRCLPLRSRFHGDYVALPKHGDQGSADDPLAALIHTPFFVTLGDTGQSRRLYFHANETVASRNFKRGMVGFLSFAHPQRSAVRRLAQAAAGDRSTYTAVDQDPNGMYALHLFARAVYGCGGCG